MALINVTDAGGDTMELIDMDGYLIGTFLQPHETVAERFRNIVDFSCREDDIFICGAMKSGTHWTLEIISMLCNGNADTIQRSKVRNTVETWPGAELAALPSPRVLCTHINYKYLPREMTEKRCKIVLLLRTPKDVAVSHYNHVTGVLPYKYAGKWENCLHLFLEGQLEYNGWFDYVREWEELLTNHHELPIHVVYYEDLKENSIDEVYRIGQFLGVENKDNLYERITEKCQFQEMKKDKTIPEEDNLFCRPGFSFFRKGEIGDWKNHFTVAQNDVFDKVYAEMMKSSKLKFRYDYQQIKNQDNCSR